MKKSRKMVEGKFKELVLQILSSLVAVSFPSLHLADDRNEYFGMAEEKVPGCPPTTSLGFWHPDTHMH
jgi:hypothetical protein